jgi:large subunit ribosomal protein L4
MNLKVYSPTLEETSTLKLNSAVFESAVNSVLFSQYLRVYRNNQRVAKASVMDRGEVHGTTKKMWAQKGTGRARHGSAKAPIFVGGGSAHGPTGAQNYKLTLSKPLRRKALSLVLTNLVADKKIIVISDLSKLEAKTKVASALFKSLLAKFEIKRNRPKVLFITSKVYSNVKKATHNLSWVNYLSVGHVNPYLLATAHLVVVSPKVLEAWNKK